MDTMDKLLQGELQTKQKEWETYKTTDNAQTIEKAMKSAGTNLEAVEKFVDQKIFSGELEQKAIEKKMDASHEYVYESFENSVKYANQSFAQKMTMKFGRAELTQKDLEHEANKLPGFANASVKEAGEKKKRDKEKDRLKEIRAINAQADLVTARESISLEAYSKFFSQYAKPGKLEKGKSDETFRRIIQGAGDQQEQEKLYTKLRFHALPFLKTYKKGWFGRIYDLNGKRIKLAAGEEHPEEYNKRVLEGLALETSWEAFKGKNGQVSKENLKILKENRRKKGKILEMLTKELLAFKLTPNMLTDEYMADHILEIQQYADKLQAYRNLVGDNDWFFNGTDEEGKECTWKNPQDPLFAQLIHNRIRAIATPLATFLDQHYSAHCHYRKGESQITEKGFLKAGMEHFPRSQEDENYNVYVKEQMSKFGSGFSYYDLTGASEEEKEKYLGKLKAVREEGLADAANNLTAVISMHDKAQQRVMDRGLAKSISSDMQKRREESDQIFQKRYAEEGKYAKLPYDHDRDYQGGALIGEVKDLISKNPEAYLLFGPEIGHIYSRLYASERLAGELAAKQAVLRKKLEEADKDPKKSVFTYETANQSAAFLNEYMAKDIRILAEQEVKEISTKLEFLKENSRLCEEAIKYFLKSPAEQRKLTEERRTQLRKFLGKENLSHMFNVTKIDHYGEIMEDAIAEMRVEIRRKDAIHKEELAERPIEDKDIPIDQRAFRIAEIRRRGKHNHNLQQGRLANIEKGRQIDTQTFLEEIMNTSQFNFKNAEIPADTVDEATESMGILQIEDVSRSIMNGTHLFLNQKTMNDPGVMQIYLEAMKAKKLVPADMGVDYFCAMIQTRIRMLNQHYNYHMALRQIQMDTNYAYFDMKRLSNLTDDELKAYLDILEKKTGEKENQYNKLYEAGKKSGKTKPGTEDALREFMASKQIYDLSVKYATARKNAGKYITFDEEAISHESRKLWRSRKVKKLQKEEFFLANERYLEFKEIMEDPGNAVALNGRMVPKEFEEEREKSDKIRDEQKTRDYLLIGVQKLMSIKLDDTMIANLRDVNNTDKDLDRDVLIRLLSDWNTIRNMDWILSGSEENDSKVNIDMREMLNAPDQAENRAQIRRKLLALQPYRDAIGAYLKTMNYGATGFRTRYAEKSLDTDEKKAGAKAEFLNRKKSLNKSLKKLEQSIGEYKEEELEKKIADTSKKVLEDLYAKGEKLSVNDLAGWHKLLSSMAKKGFFEEDEDQMWYRLSVQELLDRWPYSFEAFVTERVRQDTGKAVETALKNLLGKKGAGQILDTSQEKKEEEKQLVDPVHAGEISMYISERETGMSNVLSENDRKELDRALTVNHYDTRFFKYIMRPVKVSVAGQPATEADKKNRERNTSLAKDFRAFCADPKSAEAAYWCEDVVTYGVIPFRKLNLTPEMLEESFIRENFNKLYDMTRTILFMKELYKNGFFNEEKMRSHVQDADLQKLEAAFGTGKNSYYEKFCLLIDAYARKNLVGEDGRIDLGLSNEQLQGEHKKEKKNQEDRLEAAMAAAKKRAEEFEQLKNEVLVELDREKVAKNVAKADAVSNLGAAVKIGSADKLVKVSGRTEGSGRITDFTLLVADQNLDRLVEVSDTAQKECNMAQREAEEAETKVAEYKKNNQAVPMELQNDLEMKQIKFQGLLTYVRDSESKISDYQQVAQKLRDSYNLCHNEQGQLELKKVNADGSVQDTTRFFAYFHLKLARNMKSNFDYTKACLEKYQKMDANAIVKHTADASFPEEYKNLKRMSLYLGLLEMDLADIEKAETARIESNKNKSKKDRDTTKVMDRVNAALKDVTEKDTVPGNQERYKDAYEMLHTVVKKEKAFIKAVHDCLKKVDAAVYNHGIAKDGAFIEDVIKENARTEQGEIYNQEEQNKIRNETMNKGYQMLKEQTKKEEKKGGFFKRWLWGK